MSRVDSVHIPFLLLIMAYLALAVGYQRAVPLFEAPDEPSHIQYVGFLSTQQRLPLYGARPDVPGEGMQPPLYYLLSVPLFRFLVEDPSELLMDLRSVNLSLYERIREPRRREQLVTRRLRPEFRQFNQSPELAYLRHLRWPSLFFGLLAVTLTYVAGLRAFADARLAALCAGLLALNPQFLFTSAYVSNDTAATAVGASTLLLTVVALRDRVAGRRRYYLLAALLAVLALLTKTSILPVLVVTGLIIFWVDGRPIGRRLRDGLWALALLMVLVAPYLAWNVAYRGDLLGMNAVWESASNMLDYEAYGGALSYFTGMYWIWTFESFWGRFGWINVLAPSAVYLAYFVLTGAGFLGFYLVGRGTAASSPMTADRQVVYPRYLHFYLAGSALIMLASHLWLNSFTAQPQGRHLFPAAAQIASLLGIGIARLLGGKSSRIGMGSLLVVLLLLIVLATYCCVGVIVPAYR